MIVDVAFQCAKRVVRSPVVLGLRAIESLRAKRARHELAVCAIFRDEAPFLGEWIAFHQGVGASHFYLYNNFSQDDFRTVLAPWVERQVVTLVDWPVPVGQLSAYRDCIRRAREDCRWIAFIDIDEFLFRPDGIDVRPVLQEFADLPGVEVWQLFFGSDGHAKRPPLPVTEAYRKRAPKTRTTVKTIANPRFVYRAGVHKFKCWGGAPCDTSRRPAADGRTPVLDRLRINHYWSRSLEDLKTKVARGDASTPDLRQEDWHQAFELTLNEEPDDTILPIARSIRDGHGAIAATPTLAPLARPTSSTASAPHCGEPVAAS